MVRVTVGLALFLKLLGRARAEHGLRIKLYNVAHEGLARMLINFWLYD